LRATSAALLAVGVQTSSRGRQQLPCTAGQGRSTARDGTRIVPARNGLWWRWNSCRAHGPDLAFAEHTTVIGPDAGLVDCPLRLRNPPIPAHATHEDDPFRTPITPHCDRATASWTHERTGYVDWQGVDSKRTRRHVARDCWSLAIAMGPREIRVSLTDPAVCTPSARLRSLTHAQRSEHHNRRVLRSRLHFLIYRTSMNCDDGSACSGKPSLFLGS
jgi:hypothetical protein